MHIIEFLFIYKKVVYYLLGCILCIKFLQSLFYTFADSHIYNNRVV